VRTRVRGGSGFTLIELLVVIAIIAILAAILFPVFARAKAKAQETQCLSNVKQLATAVITYISDYDQMAPHQILGDYRDSDDDDFVHIWNALTPYFKTVDIIQCPTAPDAVSLGDIPGVGFLSSSYEVNGAWWGKCNLFRTSLDDDCMFPLRVYNTAIADSAQYPGGLTRVPPIPGAGVNLDRCANPSGRYMLWDAEIDTTSCAADWTWADVFDLDPYGHGCCGSKPHPFKDGFGGSGCVDVTPVLRHNNGMNVAFFDGHAKRQSRSETEAVMGWNWDNYELTTCP